MSEVSQKESLDSNLGNELENNLIRHAKIKEELVNARRERRDSQDVVNGIINGYVSLSSDQLEQEETHVNELTQKIKGLIKEQETLEKRNEILKKDVEEKNTILKAKIELEYKSLIDKRDNLEIEHAKQLSKVNEEISEYEKRLELLEIKKTKAGKKADVKTKTARKEVELSISADPILPKKETKIDTKTKKLEYEGDLTKEEMEVEGENVKPVELIAKGNKTEIKNLESSESEPADMDNIMEKYTQYKIKEGDTLANIAKRFGVYVTDIMEVNPKIKHRDKIIKGQNIQIRTFERVKN